MQIALCHENVLPHRGGAEMYVADLARQLAAAGHEVQLFASNWDRAALPDRIEIHCVPAPTGSRAARPWQFSAALCKVLSERQPSVSIGFDKTLGTDVYYPLGGLQAASADHNLLKHRAGWRRRIARLAQKLDAAQRSYSRLEHQIMTNPRRPLLIANSRMVRQHAVQYYGREPGTIPVIHNAIDPLRFAERDRSLIRAQVRQQWTLNDEHVAGAMIAMNYRLKGLEPLLRSLTLLPPDSPFRLLIAGSPKFGQWQQLARSLGVDSRVHFLGHCSDVRQLFFAADLLVHPTFYDPCSLVVLEAMACGLPVITTSNNGASELLSADSGSILNDPHDIATMANTITEWTDSNRRQLGRASARAASTRWTFDHHVRALAGVLAEVAGLRRKAAG